MKRVEASSKPAESRICDIGTPNGMRAIIVTGEVNGIIDSQNRGYVAIPEVGDQVMVSFVHNHPDRPFVMGGMFHGQVGLGGGSDNRVKSIQTRSGHRIIFTEDEVWCHPTNCVS